VFVRNKLNGVTAKGPFERTGARWEIIWAEGEGAVADLDKLEVGQGCVLLLMLLDHVKRGVKRNGILVLFCLILGTVRIVQNKGVKLIVEPSIWVESAQDRSSEKEHHGMRYHSASKPHEDEWDSVWLAKRIVDPGMVSSGPEGTDLTRARAVDIECDFCLCRLGKSEVESSIGSIRATVQVLGGIVEVEGCSPITEVTRQLIAKRCLLKAELLNCIQC
jgi:hypothetical protein